MPLLRHLEHVAELHRRVACQRRGRLFDRSVAAILGQRGQRLLDRRGRTTGRQLSRHGGDAQATRPELLVLQTKKGKLGAVVRRRRDQGRLHVHRLRNEERLARATARAQTLEQTVVQHALVRRVLVDEDKSVWSLRDQVTRSGLTYGTQNAV